MDQEDIYDGFLPAADDIFTNGSNGQGISGGVTTSSGYTWNISPSNITKGNVPNISNTTLGNKTSAVNPFFNLLQTQCVDEVKYIIERLDGSTLELVEQQMITPREMIGVAKFLTMINTFMVSAHGQSNYTVMWSDLIKTLRIERHFVPGPHRSQYSTSGSVLHVFLIDGQ